MNTITAFSGMNMFNSMRLRENSTETTKTPVPQTEQQADSFSTSFKGNLVKNIHITPTKKIMGAIAAFLLAATATSCTKEELNHNLEFTTIDTIHRPTDTMPIPDELLDLLDSLNSNNSHN